MSNAPKSFDILATSWTFYIFVIQQKIIFRFILSLNTIKSSFLYSSHLMVLLELQKRFNFDHNNLLFHDRNFIKNFQKIRNWFQVIDQNLTCHFRESSRRRSEHWASCDDLLDFSGLPCRFWTFLERYRAGGCESLAVDTLRWSRRRRYSRSTWTSRSTLSTRRSNPRLPQCSVLFSPLLLFYRYTIAILRTVLLSSTPGLWYRHRLHVVSFVRGKTRGATFALLFGEKARPPI